MKKLAVVMSVPSTAAALKAMAQIKNKLGQTKRTRVMFTEDGKLTFVSGILQKSIKDVAQLDKYSGSDVLILPSYGDESGAVPGLSDIKMFLNNNLGFSIFVCAVPEDDDAELASVTDNIVDIVKSNMGI
ncbi:hypothetical protein [Seleniivibrio sp.]|uniref:hypothetical protein n=1 Tax=Seleniivibrio sp. TaxID=2898801 RepID=UPI0025F47EBE|nr:hypothetical protein [Seleniivibrio sp.]MCD8554790.1 hypothetical protein [Seleniivibrio sp.]